MVQAPKHWRPLARLVTFVLGVAVIVDAITAKGQQLGQLFVGLLLIGVVPVDELLSALAVRWGRVVHRKDNGSD